MRAIAWGIIGPGTIAENFASGLAQTETGYLAAIGSREPARCQAFGQRHGVAEEKRYESYEALVADPTVDAVYIATQHPFHAEQALLAIRAGKAVLVEKPASLNETEVRLLIKAAQDKGVFFMEAFMYRCHPQIMRLAEHIGERTVGDVLHIHGTFGFDARGTLTSRGLRL